MDRIKIIILALTLILVSCKKEKQPEPTNEVNCFCGDVEFQHLLYDGPTNENVSYLYFSRNNCTNAVYKFETINEYTDKEFCLNYQW